MSSMRTFTARQRRLSLTHQPLRLGAHPEQLQRPVGAVREALVRRRHRESQPRLDSVADGRVAQARAGQLQQHLVRGVSVRDRVQHGALEHLEARLLAGLAQARQGRVRHHPRHVQHRRAPHRARPQPRRRLQRRNRPPHVPARHPRQRLPRPLAQSQPLLCADAPHPLQHRLTAQGAEAELGAPRRQRLDDAGDVVAAEAEAGDLGVELHGAPQSALGVLGHGVRLVEDDELVGRARVPRHGRAHRLGGKRLNFVPHHCDAPLVRSVQFQHPSLHQFGTVHLSGNGQGLRSFPFQEDRRRAGGGDCWS